MAAKIGTGNILFRVGSGSPSKVYLGSVAVQDVPGAPTGLAGVGFFNIEWTAPASDGGSPITAYRVYVDGVDPEVVAGDSGEFLTDTSWRFTAGGEYTFEVSAINALGEGPKSEPLTYQFA